MKPLSARATARELGIGTDTLLRRYRDGKFPAVVDDGRLIRFDLETVRKALAPTKTRKPRVAKLPAGMIPTY
jgi:predicted site-specific integrase-resolvase